MTMILSNGFDTGDFALRMVVNSGTPTPTVTATKTPFSVGKSIGWAAATTNLSSSYLAVGLTASAQVFLGCWFYVDITNGTNGSFRIFDLWADGNTTNHLYLQLNAASNSYTVVQGNGTTLISGTVNALPNATWNFLEMSATINDTTGNVVVRINGVTVGSFTGDTKNGGTNTTIDALRIQQTSSSTNQHTPEVRIDDLYVCNSAGSINNTFLGPIRIQTLSPNAAGDDSGMNVTGSANHYANVSDQSAATYNYSSVSGTRDMYNLPDLVAATSSVKAINTVVQAQNSDAGLGSLKPVVKSGGTVYYDPTVAAGASPSVVSQAIRETDPATGTAWTVSAINNLQTGAEVA